MTARRLSLLGLATFALLSLADFALTFALILSKPGAYESNPVAAAWLEKYGWHGLAGFKSLTALIVMVSLGIVCWKRPKLGIGAVLVACLLMLAIAVYSRHLMLQPE